MSVKKQGCSDTGCTRESCEGCEKDPKKFIEAFNEHSSVKNVIGIVSGKGGVGKSLVTAMLAVLMRRKGYSTGILDSDITGPSIPRMFGVSSKAKGNELGILPEKTKSNLSIMSVNLLLEQEDMPVIWRGPILANTVKQFWKDVLWGELDYLFIDMPPGTGDVPLTVFQSIPLDGIIIVTSPQELVSMIVRKAFHMAKQMNIPVLGIVENLSYVKCPDCGRQVNIFGQSNINETAGEIGTEVLGRIPVDPQITELTDLGRFEEFTCDYLSDAAARIEKIFL